MYKRILVPTDGSELAGQAIAAAIDYARASGAVVVAFSVAQPYPILPAVDGAMMIDPGIDSAELQQVAQQAVDEVARVAKDGGVACETHTAMSFLPYEEIIRAAEEYRCDVIFIASHGRRGLSRLLAGSQTQKVLAYSRVPVLVLRPELPAA
ncbi:universal stress protein [Massilia sp. R2A-15]|uniref:universal stress protein n=1 Tax=Massilia sp. R2A-15 TaxID=3064278 RepID=UPI0027353246|nr:universal stress protein [Massilia sp. R2A-15]WLI89879.1 universal stress protein [Massilia sp. R2A-15]